MSRRESWDWQSDSVYISRTGVRRVRPRLVDHVHVCPDGTRVVVSAQYIEMTDTTLYRWTVGGVPAGPTSRAGDWREVPPDWTAVDAVHAVAA